jgi:hypothetical protein
MGIFDWKKGSQEKPSTEKLPAGFVSPEEQNVSPEAQNKMVEELVSVDNFSNCKTPEQLSAYYKNKLGPDVKADKWIEDDITILNKLEKTLGEKEKIESALKSFKEDPDKFNGVRSWSEDGELEGERKEREVLAAEWELETELKETEQEIKELQSLSAADSTSAVMKGMEAERIREAEEEFKKQGKSAEITLADVIDKRIQDVPGTENEGEELRNKFFDNFLSNVDDACKFWGGENSGKIQDKVEFKNILKELIEVRKQRGEKPTDGDSSLKRKIKLLIDEQGDRGGASKEIKNSLVSLLNYYV